MTGCSAVNCKNRSDNFKLFIFPANAERRAKWVQNMHRDNWTPTSGSRLCEIHFEDSQFEQNRRDGLRKLMPNAVPTLFNVPNSPRSFAPDARKLICKKNSCCVETEKQKKNTKFLQASEETCFICDGFVDGKGVPLLMASTPYSSTELPAKIGQLMGDGFMVIVAVTDILCERCSSLINQLDKLEYDAMKVKHILREFLNIKYHLNESTNSDYGLPYDESSPTSTIFEDSSVISANIISAKCNIKKKDSFQSPDTKYDTAQSIKIENCKIEEYGIISEHKVNNTVEFREKDDANKANIFVDKNDALPTIGKTDIHSEYIEKSLNGLSVFECNSCSFNTTVLETLVSHLKIHCRKDFYKCIKCYQKFETHSDLDNHLESAHGKLPISYLSKLKVFECSVCKFRHNNKRIFDIHMGKHKKKEQFTCSICMKVFKHRVTLKKHLSSHQIFKCDLCYASFQNKVSLTNHIKSHSKGAPLVNDMNVIIVNSLENISDKNSLHCEDNVGANDFKVKALFESNKASQFDQVEILLERIHSEDPKENFVSFSSVSVDVDKNIHVNNNIIEVDVNSTQINNELVDSGSSSILQQSILDQCAFKEQNGENTIDKTIHNFIGMENSCLKEAKEGRSNSEILTIFSNGDESCEENQYLDTIENNIEQESASKDNFMEQENEDQCEDEMSYNSDLKNDNISKKIYVCSLCGLKTPSESHIKRHFKRHIALEQKTYKCHICERVLTTHSNLKRHVSLHETCEGGSVECNMCKEILTDRLHLKHHTEVKHPESYQCSFCDRRFESKKLCREHESLHPALQCDICQKMFLTEGRLKSHKLFMHSEANDSISRSKIFKCHICLKILTTYHNLKRHLQNHEKCSGPVSCMICNEELTDKLHLRQHVGEKHPENHQCSFCHKVFNTRRSCKAHELIHSEQFVYKCEFCEKLFLTAARLKRHQDIMHRDPHCQICGKEITNPLKLLDHERRHERHKTKFPCDQCPKVFRTPSGLKYHMSVHTGKYAVYCEICGKGLHSEVVLEEHKATHTKEVRYTCEKCGRTFSSNSTYRMHRLWHDNPLPYKCEICDRKFKHTSILAVHKRRAHTGERPYKCPHCSQTFSVSSTLNKHIILHTKEYPYRCEECDKGFTTRTKIARHMAKVHNDYNMLNAKKKACEYKMVLHPSELTHSTKNASEESFVDVDSLIPDAKGSIEEEEVHTATLQVLENVTMDPAQEAIFTIFQQDFTKF